ncbi:MAG TPA: hypothetical protein VM344_03225 [Vitreimonas sp.]|nr:hypothetical protein [Vitreimonas sp.]
MPVFFPRSPRPRARRTSGPARALAAVLALCLVLALGASMTTGRTSGPVGPIDAALLTRVVPPERTSLDATPHAPALAQLDPIPDFAGGDRSFGPRPEPALPQSVGVLIKPTPTPRRCCRPR